MPGKEQPLHAEQSPSDSKEAQRVLAVERLQAAEIAVARRTAHLNGKADEPVCEEAARIHDEVHHVGVVGILHAAQPRLYHGEARLHEHDQEAADQRPGEVDADLVLPNLIGDIGDRNADLRIAAGTSLMVPVRVPPGSPCCNVAVVGAAAAAALSCAVAEVSA